MQPKVSVCLITYNQEKFVRQALEGIVTQKFSHSLEIIVSDDCSTDNTPAIIGEYASKYPAIKILNNEHNLGMHRNWEKAIKACKGQYIALLEGDDFWNDDLKLEKQVKILDSHTGITISFTNAHVINEVSDVYYPKYVTVEGDYFEMSDLLKANFIPTCTVVYRSGLFTGLPPAFFRSPYADWIIHILNTRSGGLHFLNEKTATYRLHSGGVFGNSDEQKRLERLVRAYNCIEEVLMGSKWAPLVDKNRKDAKYSLRQYLWKAKDYMGYIKLILTR